MSSFALWLLSFFSEYVLERCLPQKAFWPVVCKDVFVSLGVIALVLVTQWGIMNSCSCWSTFGRTGVYLPQIPQVQAELMHYIRDVAPWITLGAIVFQLVFCMLVIWTYSDAIRIYIQRDDGKSNCFWRNPRNEMEPIREEQKGGAIISTAYVP
jgi:hypothetical protein